ncbi:TPA: hypothetical protein ACJKDM_002218, partial [Neisseria meningitidis]
IQSTPATSVKIFLFNQLKPNTESKMNPAPKKPSLLFSSLPQRRRQVKTAAAARIMCRRI